MIAMASLVVPKLHPFLRHNPVAMEALMRTCHLPRRWRVRSLAGVSDADDRVRETLGVKIIMDDGGHVDDDQR